MHNLNLTMRTYQTNPNWGTVYKYPGLSFSENVTVMKDKERLRELFHSGEDRRDMTLTCNTQSWVESWT